MKPFHVIVTCEHAGADVPGDYRSLFRGREHLLKTHRGWDRGALVIARRLADTAGAPLYYSTVTRLLVDLNRTAPRCLSRELPKTDAAPVLERYYHPYRQQVEAEVAGAVEQALTVLHLSVHSFTPEWHGVQRTAELGLLYDPARAAETQFCIDWQARLRTCFPAWRIRRNYPYRGRDDGFTTSLRTRFPNPLYLGIELECNQRLDASGPWVDALCDSLALMTKKVQGTNSR